MTITRDFCTGFHDWKFTYLFILLACFCWSCPFTTDLCWGWFGQEILKISEEIREWIPLSWGITSTILSFVDIQAGNYGNKNILLRETCSSSSSSVIFWKNTQKMTVAFPCWTTENSCLTKTISLYSLRLNKFVFSYILLFNQINQSILGGLVVEFGQKLFDMSIRTRARQMEKFLRDPVNFDNL